jgi:hypothetical protein
MQPVSKFESKLRFKSSVVDERIDTSVPQWRGGVGVVAMRSDTRTKKDLYLDRVYG